MLIVQGSKLLLKIMKSIGRVYNKAQHRITFEGIFYRLHTGIPWRNLSVEFGVGALFIDALTCGLKKEF